MDRDLLADLVKADPIAGVGTVETWISLAARRRTWAIFLRRRDHLIFRIYKFTAMYG